MGRRTLPALLACLLGLAAGPAAGEEGPVGPSDSGWVDRARKPVPDAEHRRSVGPFCALLLISDDPKLFERWGQPSEVFSYQGITRVRKGATFVAVVAFANPGVDASGNARLVADLALLRPDGSSYGGIEDVVAWQGPPAPKDVLELTTKYLMARIEPGDPLGTYEVVATIRDEVSGRALTLKAPLRVEASGSRNE